MDQQTHDAPAGPDLDFHSMDEMELAEHPRIKGLPRRRQDVGTTLLEGSRRYPWLRTKDHVATLTRLVSFQFGLVRVLAGWVPNCPSYELKTELPQRIYEDMRHILRLRDRLNQLPGTRGPIEAGAELQALLAQLGQADDHHCFLSAVFFDVKRELLQTLEDYRLACDPLYDAPTIYELRGIIPELREQIEWANVALLESRLDLATAARVDEWRNYVRTLLGAAGGVLGDRPRGPAPEASPARAPLQPAPETFCGDPRMRYMERFPLDESEDPVHMSLREIVYHNATEWAVIDHLYVLFYGIKNMPLEFYVDLSRHTWDEARHSRMGMRRLREMGFEPFRDFQWPYYPRRTEQQMAEWFGSLTMLAEACSFTRKHGSVQPFYRFGDPLSAQQSEVDCVDERLHVTFGRRWLPVMAALAGDKRPLGEIVRGLRERSILSQTDVELDALSREQKLELAHSATTFCNAIEFSLDFTVY